MRHLGHFFPLNAIKVEVADEIETIFASRVQLCTTGRRHLEHSHSWIIRKSNIYCDISLKDKSSSKERWETGVITFEI